ncbi:MAG TPA: citrate synthase family protein [Devosiaceae bacterium]
MTTVTSPRLDAATAAERLGVSRATLYAYVSRGWIRAFSHPDDPRARLYSAQDIEAFIRRKAGNRRPDQAAASALDWGMPTLRSDICTIENGHLAYRNRDAIELARKASLEETAALLWQDDGLGTSRFDPDQFPGWRDLARSQQSNPAMLRALALLPLCYLDESPGLAGRRLFQWAGTLVRALAAGLLAIEVPQDREIHEALAIAWGRPEAADAIRVALVLVADHEMNASTFAVRVIASTGATLGACLTGGLAALSGPRHGGMIARVAAFCEEATSLRDAAATITARLNRGDDLPGFGHRLYPEGDPRAELLLARIGPYAEQEIAASVEKMTGLRPGIDFALHALERRHGLPPESGFAIFAIGRAVGWMAHAVEQRATGQLIRPRAHSTPRPSA